MQGQYNMRSPAVKRLMKEAQELNEPTELYHAQPLEDNLFEWHFTLRGPEDSEFESGIYHGRIILPPDYPMKPPSIILLTPNGRFETFKKICLSISGHHPESWQPSWSIRTALLALIGFMPTHGGGAIGSLDYTPEERKVLAKKSQDWKCPDCGVVTDKLKPVTQESEKVSQEAKALASQINFQGEKKGALESNSEGQSAAASSPATLAAASSTPAPTSPPPASPPGPFPFPWAMPPGWNPSTAGVSGGMAFPRFPYPPPFMMPGLGSAGRPGGQQQMPMFPPPLPFFPSMFPGFPPVPGQPGAAVASPNATTVPSSQANTVGGGVMSSVASTSLTTAAPPAVTTATPSASQPLAPSTSNTTATETVGTSSVRPTTASTPQTSVAGPTPAATSTTGISSPQPATTTSPSAPTTTGLRQRQTATSRPATTSAAQTTTSPRSQTSQRVSLVLMLVVAFIIGMLLARRVYMQFYGPHYRGVMD